MGIIRVIGGAWEDAPAYKMRLKEGPRTFPLIQVENSPGRDM